MLQDVVLFNKGLYIDVVFLTASTMTLTVQGAYLVALPPPSNLFYYVKEVVRSIKPSVLGIRLGLHKQGGVIHVRFVFLMMQEVSKPTRE